MSGARVALKVISVMLIILAVMELILGVLLLVGSSIPEMASSLIAFGDQTLTESEGALALGIVFTVSGLIYLIIGLLGMRGARRPKRIGPFFWLSVVGSVLSILGIIYGYVSGGFVSPATIVSAVVVIVCAVLAGIIRSGNHKVVLNTSKPKE